MKALYPRKAGEFAEHNRRVILRCEGCGHNETLDPQLVIFTFGQDFDLFEGFPEMRSRLSCSRCGAARPALRFYDPDQKHFGPISYEEALASSLELNAFVRARDGDEPVRQGSGRFRKFGAAVMPGSLALQTLDQYKIPLIRFDCPRCKRNAEMDVAKLRVKFGGKLTLGEVARQVAAGRGCALAQDADHCYPVMAAGFLSTPR